MKRLFLIAFLILALAIPCQAARLLTSGFEINHNGSGASMGADGVEFDISYWETADDPGNTTQTVTKRSGNRALKFKNTTGNWGGGGWITTLPTMGAGQTYFSRFYIRIHTRTTTGGTDPKVGLWGSSVVAGLTGASVMLNTDGVEVSIDDTDCHLALRNFRDDVQIGASSAALDLDTWYGVEFSYAYDTGYSTLKYWKDGFYGTTLTTVVSNGAALANLAIASCAIGLGLSDTTTGEGYCDDWAINDNTGSYQNSWPGEGKVIMLQPNATGDVTNWSGTYASVNENPPDDASTIIQSKTLNQESLFRFGASGIGATDIVNVVQVNARYAGAGASANSTFKLEIEKVTGGTVQQSAAITPANTTWITNGVGLASIPLLTAHVDPDGNAWTKATLDTLQAGVKCTTSSTNYANVSTLWVAVEYVPAVRSTVRTPRMY